MRVPDIENTNVIMQVYIYIGDLYEVRLFISNVSEGMEL